MPEGTVQGAASRPGEGAAGAQASQPEGGNVGNAPELTINNLEDVRKYAPQLEGLAKQLDADYRRKTEEISQIRNKAEAFTELMGDPVFRSFMANQYGVNAPAGPQGNESRAENKPKLDIDLNNELLDDNIKKTVTYMQDYISVLEKKIAGLEGSVASFQNDNEISSLKQEFPDIEEKLPTLYPLMKKGYTLKAAYLDKYGDSYFQNKLEEAKRKSENELEDQQIRNEVGSVLPLTGAGSGTFAPTDKKLSIGGAIKKAMSQHSGRQ